MVSSFIQTFSLPNRTCCATPIFHIRSNRSCSDPVMASTSQASPETAAKVVSRQRPKTQIAPRGPPSKATFVWFYHPANDCSFLTLPAFDCCPPNSGIHYGTAITACQILACNEDGYLSTSRNRNADGRINIDLDSIIPSEEYYYHLNFPRSEALYPICRDFSC